MISTEIILVIVSLVEQVHYKNSKVYSKEGCAILPLGLVLKNPPLDGHKVFQGLLKKKKIRFCLKLQLLWPPWLRVYLIKMYLKTNNVLFLILSLPFHWQEWQDHNSSKFICMSCVQQWQHPLQKLQSSRSHQLQMNWYLAFLQLFFPLSISRGNCIS